MTTDNSPGETPGTTEEHRSAQSHALRGLVDRPDDHNEDSDDEGDA